MRRMPSLCAFLITLAAASVAAPACAQDAAPIAGRSIVEVLRDAGAAGLRIVYSGALVPPELRVEREPDATDPVGRLREILEPHGLALEELEAGAFVVVRSRERRPGADAADGPLEEVRVLSSRYRLEGTRPVEPLALGAIDLESQPVLLDDAARGIRRFPGTAGSAFSSRVFVRGGLSDENLVLLDGVPLHEPFHLPGLPADLSLLDPVTLDKVDFYSGVLPVEYGDRMSAVLDMRTRPAAERFGGRASLGTMHASAMLEGTLPGARGDWLAFARRSLLDHFARLLAPELGGPRLSDALVRVRYHLRDGSVLMVGGLAADDDIELAVRDGIEVSRGESDRSYVWSALDTRWGSSAVRTLFTHESSSIDRVGELQDPAGSTGAVIDRRRIATTMLRQDWRRPLARNGALRWGASARRDHVDYEYSREVAFPAQVAALYGQDISSRFDLTTVAKLTEYEAYAGMSEELGARWSIEGGLHWTHADYSTGQAGSVWDPRIAFLYRVSPATRVRLAWGRMTQTWSASELPVEVDDSRFAAPSRSTTRVLGWEHELDAGIELRVELFDKEVRDPRARRENLLDPITLVPELRPDAIVVRPDRARIAGVDVHASGPLGADLTGWLSYSWSHARDLIAAREVARSWDQRHALAAGLSLDRGPWLLSGALTARSDWPVTPIVSTPDGPGIGVRNSERDGLYFTLDLRAERRFSVAHGDLRVALELQNATNRSNHCCTELRFERDAAGALAAREIRRNWAPLVPLVSIAWEF